MSNISHDAGPAEARLAMLRRRQLAFLLLTEGLAIWLAIGSIAASGGWLARGPALVLAVLLMLNAWFFQLDGLKRSKPLRMSAGAGGWAMRKLMVLGGPFVVYPAAIIALILSPFAAPGLIVPQIGAALVATWPAVAMFATGIAFALRR